MEPDWDTAPLQKTIELKRRRFGACTSIRGENNKHRRKPTYGCKALVRQSMWPHVATPKVERPSLPHTWYSIRHLLFTSFFKNPLRIGRPALAAGFDDKSHSVETIIFSILYAWFVRSLVFQIDVNEPPRGQRQQQQQQQQTGANDSHTR